MSFRLSLQAVARSSKNTSRTIQPCVALGSPMSSRCLSVSARRLASQEEEFATAFAQSPLYNVIKSHPTAMQAIKEIGDLMQTKGIDLTQPPSKMTMFKLAMDSDFRTAITNVMKELKAAGVDVTPEVCTSRGVPAFDLTRIGSAQNVQQLMGPLGKK
ncbi:hypothetical protein QFC20_006488 [Naganishia adeliensis]|uniref:Uncharacterized protein n=1 Tax=Naganishia adeliensis TaxID=92952 RepID=A0ACC2VAM2_9TREE|nr:hypothetical protein QFC20_006488 [Naganishia adeliensis]